MPKKIPSDNFRNEENAKKKDEFSFIKLNDPTTISIRCPSYIYNVGKFITLSAYLEFILTKMKYLPEFSGKIHLLTLLYVMLEYLYGYR